MDQGVCRFDRDVYETIGHFPKFFIFYRPFLNSVINGNQKANGGAYRVKPDPLPRGLRLRTIYGYAVQHN